jgi:oligoribonuclease
MGIDDRSTAYIWFDLEFSSLDLDNAIILQVAVLATKTDLTPCLPGDSGLNIYVQIPADVSLSPWVEDNLKHVLDRCRSADARPLPELEEALLAYLDRTVGPPHDEVKKRPVLAGNSVHNDWAIARRLLPRFVARLHYRLLDVSALKIQWIDYSEGEDFEKENEDILRANLPSSFLELDGSKHDAAYDIRASLAELNYYRACLLKNKIQRNETDQDK